MEVRAKKYLGQHFLTDISVAKVIAETLPVDNDLPVLEVGPGMGMLTQFLISTFNDRLTVVEVDGESVDYLHDKWPDLRVVAGDFLKINLKEMYGGEKFMVIGNYPYNISSQIFFKVLEHRDQIPVCSGMIQKEVAERIAAAPGSKTYGITSVLLQAFYDIEYVTTVHENVFNPPPKVKSAVIRMTRNGRESLGCDEEMFIKIVKTAFNQRRKTMRNSLKSLLDNKIIDSDIFNSRPETLSVGDFVNLTNIISGKVSINFL
ncbi:MAG: 16S rRNA (adenine(1518)-N(6)/adenine(1519)-N(6))-dimethyltransferase RsmA [Paludibacteraceae bacterium]|nr:16S rRNA (adenine(1518)-N(6)/adenine(1519)-N(6))-dimethyltransferase RsmA [Paludibacteraceae bacterium]